MIGSTISHYRIAAELGRGGMGVVYAAEDTRLSRRVALKFLGAQLTGSREERARFLREAQSAASLGDHPNICTVHDIAESEQGPFIVMALVEGQSLQERLQPGPLSAEMALDVAMQVARGLATAHDRGIVHRDVKPGNILIDGEGTAKITDFGLAKLVDATELTRTATTLGTAAYMSPEQAAGRAVDGRSDQWSLGVVLYQMLTARLPFERENAQAMIHAILTEDPTPLTEHAPDLAPEIGWVVDRCLRRDPQDRYSSTQELLSDLQALHAAADRGEGRTLELRAGPMARRGRRRWSPLRTALAAAVVLLAVGTLEAVRRAGVFQAAAPLEPQEEGDFVQPWERERPTRVAVAGFTDRTGDASFAGLGELAAESISQLLTATGLVEVVPIGETAASASPEQLDPGDVAAAVDADVYVGGRFYREGSSVRFQASVNEVETGRLITSLPPLSVIPDAPREGIEQLCQRVAGAVTVYADNAFREPLPLHPPTYDAHMLVRKAREEFDDGWATKYRRQAIEDLRAAVAVDSTYLRPLLMECALHIFQQNTAEVESTIVRDLLPRADRLDEYERRLMHMLLQQAQGNVAGALLIAEELRAEDPDNLFVGILQAGYHSALRMPGHALRLYEEMDLERALGKRLLTAMQTQNAMSYAHALGDHQRELELSAQMNAQFPLLLLQIQEAVPWAALGRIDQVQRVLEECLASPGARGFVDFALFTTIAPTLVAHGLGEASTALIDEYLAQRIPRPHEPPGYAHNRAMLLYVAGHYEEARQGFRDYQESHPGTVDDSIRLAKIAARLGEVAQARSFLDAWVQTVDTADRNAYRQSLMVQAEFAALFGERDRAVALLREAAAYGQAMTHTASSPYHDLDLIPLHGYAPFERLFELQDGELES